MSVPVKFQVKLELVAFPMFIPSPNRHDHDGA